MPELATLQDYIDQGFNILFRCTACNYWRSRDPAKLLQQRLDKGRSIDLEQIRRASECSVCYSKGYATLTPTKRPCDGPLARARGIDRMPDWKDVFADTTPSGKDLARM